MEPKTVTIIIPDGYELEETVAQGDKVFKIVHKEQGIELKKIEAHPSALVEVKECGTLVAYIGKEHAPAGLWGRCIVLSSRFKWIITENKGRTIAVPHPI